MTRTAVNFPLLLEKGLDGLRDKVAERRSRINLTVLEDLHGEQFLKAIDIVLDAVSQHITRFAALARQMAGEESRESRRKELLTIAENCEVIAHQPPQTFWQALQLCYFIQLILQIESNGHSVSFGRMDQYLYPYYRRDVELNQTLDREHAIELLHSCWLKLLEVNKIRSGSHSKASAGSPLYQNVTIGGQNLINGQPMDAVNPLSYAILESCGRLRSTQPNLSVRYHAGMSNDFLDACVGSSAAALGCRRLTMMKSSSRNLSSWGSNHRTLTITRRSAVSKPPSAEMGLSLHRHELY